MIDSTACRGRCPQVYGIGAGDRRTGTRAAVHRRMGAWRRVDQRWWRHNVDQVAREALAVGGSVAAW